MPKIVLRLEHQLRGLDDGNRKEPEPTALAFVVDILVLVVPAVVIVLSAALAVYLLG
jgi:hypothetical protein